MLCRQWNALMWRADMVAPVARQAHWYLTQLLMDSLKAAAPEARVVFTTSPSESKTEDIDWDNLE